MTLVAKDNKIDDMDITVVVLGTLQHLRSLDLRNNPITKLPNTRRKLLDILWNWVG